jgi:hypothetical protein
MGGWDREMIDWWVPCLRGKIDNTHWWRDQLGDKKERYRPKSDGESSLSDVSYALVRGSYAGVLSRSR